MKHSLKKYFQPESGLKCQAEQKHSKGFKNQLLAARWRAKSDFI